MSLIIMSAQPGEDITETPRYDNDAVIYNSVTKSK